MFLAVWGLTGQAPRAWSETFTDSAALSGLYQTAALLLSFLGVYVIVWLWLKYYERRPFWTVGFERPGAVGKVLRGTIVGIAMLGGAVALMAALGFAAAEEGPPQLQGAAAMSGVVIATLGWAVQGPAEEVICRGWMLPVLAARYRVWVGILISSIFFAVMHGMNPNLTLIAAFNLALYGVFAALYALREGGLWGIGAQHAAWNWAQGNLFGFEVSGIQPVGGMLINLMETGPDEVTGGAFGPEGGLAITLMLALGIGVLLIKLRRGHESIHFLASGHPTARLNLIQELPSFQRDT